MENKDEILKQLNSEDPEIFAQATEKIKSEGDLTIVPLLFDLLSTGKDHYFTTEIVNLLADIKNRGFVPLLMERIKNTFQPEVKSVFLRISWESSLDFTEYAEDLINILLKDEFIVALEAATTLENLDHLKKDRKTSMLSQLKQAQTTDEKQFLIDNIIHAWEEETEKEE